MAIGDEVLAIFSALKLLFDVHSGVAMSFVERICSGFRIVSMWSCDHFDMSLLRNLIGQLPVQLACAKLLDF